MWKKTRPAVHLHTRIYVYVVVLRTHTVVEQSLLPRQLYTSAENGLCQLYHRLSQIHNDDIDQVSR